MAQDIAEKLEYVNRMIILQEESLKRAKEDTQTLDSTPNDTDATNIPQCHNDTNPEVCEDVGEVSKKSPKSDELTVKAPEKRKSSEGKPESSEKQPKNVELVMGELEKRKLSEVSEKQRECDETILKTPKNQKLSEEVAVPPEKQPKNIELIMEGLEKQEYSEEVAEPTEKQSKSVELIVETSKNRELSDEVTEPLEKQLKRHELVCKSLEKGELSVEVAELSEKQTKIDEHILQTAEKRKLSEEIAEVLEKQFKCVEEPKKRKLSGEVVEPSEEQPMVDEHILKTSKNRKFSEEVAEVLEKQFKSVEEPKKQKLSGEVAEPSEEQPMIDEHTLQSSENRKLSEEVAKVVESQFKCVEEPKKRKLSGEVAEPSEEQHMIDEHTLQSSENRKLSEEVTEVVESQFKCVEEPKKRKLNGEVAKPSEEQPMMDKLILQSSENRKLSEEVAEVSEKHSNIDELIEMTSEKQKFSEEVSEKQPKRDEVIIKTPEKRKFPGEATEPLEKESKNSEELIIKTSEHKSIIEIRISNEIGSPEKLCETLTSARVEHKIIDLEKLQGGIINTSFMTPELKLHLDGISIKSEDSPKQLIGLDSNEKIQQEPQEQPSSEFNSLLTLTETSEKTELNSNVIEKELISEITSPESKPHTFNDLTISEIANSVKIGDETDLRTENNLPIKEEEQLPIIQLTDAERALDQQYRESCTPFLQHVPCFKLKTNNDAPYDDEKVPRCRECRRKDIIPTTNEAEASTGNDVYCRFYEFRRLQYTAQGELSVAGFPNPYQDPKQEDINIWEPDEHTEPTAGYMDVQVCRYILLHVGDQFCYLWQQEVEALKMHENPDDKIAWKKLVRDIREICDVCDTTLFNYHWTCRKCGFGVCLDCFKDRKEQRVRQKLSTKSRRGRDEYHWLLCTSTQKHQLAELMLTQIITGNSLQVLGKLLHEVRIIWQIPQKCDCLLSYQVLPEGPVKEKLDEVVNEMINESRLNEQTASSSLATKETLRHQRRMEKFHKNKVDYARSLGIDYVPGRILTKETLDKDPITTAFDSYEHINFLRKGMAGYRRFLPPKVMTMCSSTMLAPNVRHEWLCDGKLLRLTDPLHPDNRILFQEVWKCGQPVMVSEVARSLNLDLWRPEAFCRDFGDKPNDLINCLNGNLVPNQPMRHFWEGFQCIKKRLLDASGNPMLLKLKDWPPGDDFAEILPTRFADLMKGLPLPEYTLRTGNLNIASCLPKMFVPPDLGPKMYNAYGSALHPDKGTTNLHLDISDAVNVMVYVGIPQDAESKSQLDAAQHAIAMGGCDFLTRLRCQSSRVMPGALWHIFAARDADKIRDLLNRVTLEKGFRLEPDHDPIHDQNWYLDDELRARLYCEYRVKGYPIVQCLGDAVFIPAGAPHQVQNLHNCIKVAEDFVSPENITHCYHLTHEFRQLSNSHTNHEDKLQIKNIIYHSVKDCCTILMRALNKRYDVELANLKRMRKLKKEQAKGNTNNLT